MIGVGLDFGTSNSAAAWYDGEKVHLVSLEEDELVMPTATHLDRELKTLTGANAVTRYIDENRDRIVELTPEVIAKSTLLTNNARAGDPDAQAESETSNVYGQPWVDRGMPGRLFRGVKRLLGDPGIRRLLVFEHPFRLVALITPVLLRIRLCIEGVLPERLGALHFGHPIRFEGQNNKLAFDRLSEASSYAGIKQLSFYPEPVAATVSYLFDKKPGDKGCVLTVDFGGGTLDLCVLEYSGDSFNVLTTAGLPLGGDHIDQMIFRELLFPLLGKGERWCRVKDGVEIESEFPFEEFEDKLLNWAVTYILNQNQYRSKVADRIREGGEAKEKFQRLQELITHNYSYLVFQAIRKAKANLSVIESTLIDIPELDLSIELTRTILERLLTPMLEQMDELITKTLVSAAMHERDIDVVIRTGGSSQIVAVRNMLEHRFSGKVIEHDPFTSVAAGLAIASYHGYQFESKDHLEKIK